MPFLGGMHPIVSPVRGWCEPLGGDKRGRVGDENCVKLRGELPDHWPAVFHVRDVGRGDQAAWDNKRFAQNQSNARQRRAGRGEQFPVLRPKLVQRCSKQRVIYPDQQTDDRRLQGETILVPPDGEAFERVAGHTAVDKIQLVIRSLEHQLRGDKQGVAGTELVGVVDFFRLAKRIGDGIALKQDDIARLDEGSCHCGHCNAIAFFMKVESAPAVRVMVHQPGETTYPCFVVKIRARVAGRLFVGSGLWTRDSVCSLTRSEIMDAGAVLVEQGGVVGVAGIGVGTDEDWWRDAARDEEFHSFTGKGVDDGAAGHG